MRRPIVFGVARGGRDSSRGGSRDVDSARDGSRTASTIQSRRRWIFAIGASRDSNAGFEDVPRSNGDSRVGGGGVVRACRGGSYRSRDQTDQSRGVDTRIRVERVVGHALAANRRPGVSALAAIRIHRIGGVRREDFDRRGNAKRRASDFDRRGDLRGAVQETRRRRVFPRRRRRFQSRGDESAVTRRPQRANRSESGAVLQSVLTERAVRRVRINRDARAGAETFGRRAKFGAGFAERTCFAAATARRGDDARSRVEVRGVDRAVDVRRGNQSDAFVTDVESTDANDDPRSSGREERRRDGRVRQRRPLGDAVRSSRRRARRVERDAKHPGGGKDGAPGDAVVHEP